MKNKYVMSLGAAVALAAALYVFKADTVVHTTFSRSGKMKAEILESRTWMLARKYQVRITTAETGISLLQGLGQLEAVPDSLIRGAKMKWRSDSNLIIEIPNNPTQIIWLGEAGPPP